MWYSITVSQCVCVCVRGVWGERVTVTERVASGHTRFLSSPDSRLHWKPQECVCVRVCVCVCVCRWQKHNAVSMMIKTELINDSLNLSMSFWTDKWFTESESELWCSFTPTIHSFTLKSYYTVNTIFSNAK